MIDGPHRRTRGWVTTIAQSFDGGPLTPRQAFHLAMATAGMEDDAFVQWDDYLQGKCTVDDLWLLSELPDWVLFVVNSVWLQRFRQVIIEIGNRIERGVAPYPRCMAERVALWIILRHAQEVQNDVESDMIDDNPDFSAALPRLDDDQEDWDDAEEQLFYGDFDFRFIWLPNFTRAIFGDPAAYSAKFNVNVSAFHPYRWWESDAETIGDHP